MIGRLAAAFSLLTTPLIIFISSANAVYLRNQSELGTDPRLLLPFVAGFAVMLSLGVVLVALARCRPIRFFLWAYYIAGPLFMGLVALQSTPFGNRLFASAAGALLWPGALLALTLFFGSRYRMRAAATPFALFAVALLMGETWRFRTGRDGSAPREPVTFSVVKRDLPPRPNVYHILLDAAQPDLFWASLTPEARRNLEGFSFYPKTKSLYLATKVSLAAMFLGRARSDGEAEKDFPVKAFNGDASLLSSLREAGYTTILYGPKLYSFDLGLFDHVVYHRDNVPTGELAELNAATFQALWLYGHLPRWLTKRLAHTRRVKHLDVEGLMLLDKSVFLPYSAPVVSRLSFLRFLRAEAALPESNRYTFVHLEIPHPPYIFRSDCATDEAAINTRPLAQYQCALRLVSAFLETLKRLDRFEPSVIIISGDHGSFYRVEGNEAVWAGHLSHDTLLLVKPPGVGAGRELDVSDAPATLLDVAPTLSHVLGLETKKTFEGCPIPLPPESPAVRRKAR